MTIFDNSVRVERIAKEGENSHTWKLNPQIINSRSTYYSYFGAPLGAGLKLKYVMLKT